MYAPSVASATNSEFRSEYLAYLEALDARDSTSTARPSLSELYAGLYQKPKVKLGPRPSAEGAARAAAGPRPVASLPPGLRSAPRKELHSANRPSSRQSKIDATIRLPPPPPIPESPQMPEILRPSTSPASVRSMPTTLASRSEKMTPEKKRLKRAMEMRKKQMAEVRKMESSVETPLQTIPEPKPEAEVRSENENTTAPLQLPESVVEEGWSLGVDLPKATSETGESAKEATASNEPQSQAEKPPAEPSTAPSPQVEDTPRQPQESEQIPAGADVNPEVSDEPTDTQASEQPPEQPPSAEEPPTDDVSPQKEEPEPAKESPALVEPAAIDDPPRASEDNAKADSVVQDEVSRLKPEVEEERPAPAISPSPTSVQQPSELPSTRPSSVSEAGEEGTSIKPLTEQAVQATEQSQQTHPSGNIDKENEGGASAASIASLATEQFPTLVSQEPSPTSDKERTGGVPKTDKGEAVAGESEDSDVTPTEKQIVHTGDSLILTPVTPKNTKRSRRLGMIAPIDADAEPKTPGTDDSELDLSDDDLMSELQDAEVQEARPMQITKEHSPISARFPRSAGSLTPKSTSASPVASRRPSQPLLKVGSEHSLSNITRSASSGQVNKLPAGDGTITVAKSVNVSSGISQRIKALARNSSSSEVALNRTPSQDSNGQSIVALRKSSFGASSSRPQSSAAPPMPGGAGERVAALSRHISSRGESADRSPPTPRDSIHTVYNVSQRSGRPESISVTARIVRDDRTQKPNVTAPTRVAPLELHESPLIIEHKHERTNSATTGLRMQTPKTASSSDPAESRSPSSPSYERGTKMPISPTSRSSIDNWRSSFSIGRPSRRASDARPPQNMIASASSTSLGTTVSRDSDVATEKKGSRSSRILKRMSNSISLGKRTSTQIIGPTLEEPASFVPERVPEEVRSARTFAVEIGDLNVQLPDTLLWKRRWVEIDGRGNFLVRMSKSNEMANTKNNTKIFHMSELKRPFLPDQERQEMPYSVVIDFVDGRTMQCACETAGGQSEVLKLLQSAHETYSRL